MQTITPTRGDRSKLLDNCIRQMQDQTKSPSDMIIINHPPISTAPDITERIIKGMDVVTSDMVAIIEDDDYYPSNYLEVVREGLKTHDIVGFDFSYYYHVKTKRWAKFSHPGRASLFCTSFRPHVLNDFSWPRNDYVFLDIKLWEYFNAKGYKVKWIKEDDCRPIGMKHGIGKTGGKGHTHSETFKNKDEKNMWLWLHLESKSFEFYSNL